MSKPLHSASSKFLTQGLFSGINSFATLEKRIAELPSDYEKGAAFEVFAEAYFVTQPITQSKHVWPQEALPQNLINKLSLSTKDMGVDGVIETSFGLLNTYQVKFRTNRTSLRWKELSTFVGLSDKANQRILITNSEDLPDVLNDRKGFYCIRGSDLDRLEKRDFMAIELWLKQCHVERKYKHPHPHQDEALQAILSSLKTQNRVTTIMACGSGKTLIELWAAERVGASNILVLVPSLALIRQTLHEWLRETSWPVVSYLCVCSDPTVTKGVDTVVVKQSDLDFPVTTDGEQVRTFLTKPFNGVKIVFSTYQSAHVVGKATRGLEPFQLGILDEAHKTAGREGQHFNYALNDNNLQISKRLFLTATPRHFDIRKKDKEGDAQLVYSMDKPEIYGPVSYTLTFGHAAQRNIICGYKVVISVVTSSMVDEYFLSHGEVIVEKDLVRARQVANQIAIRKAVDEYGVKRIFTFHPSVASAKSFTSPGGEGIGSHLPDFKVFHVNGKMRTAKRDGLMNEFKEAKCSLMSNARCLTEGVDVPAVDMVVFMSPRKSRVDIVQAVGRAMRKSSDKSTGYILLPLYLEQTKNESVEEAVERSDFAATWDVLEALREQDEVLAEVVCQMREDSGRVGGFNDSKFKERVEFLGPTMSIQALSDAITTKCIEKLGTTWDERFGQLKAYKECFGDCNVPDKWSENPTLGSWVQIQRHAYKGRKGFSISDERIDKLEKLGFVWDILETGWEEMYTKLSDYKSRYGNCQVPAGWPENPRLYAWCTTQRSAYKGKVGNKLGSERISKLEALGFNWVTGRRVVPDCGWEEMYEKLNEYKLLYGDCNIQKDRQDYKELRRWCISQRSLYTRGLLKPHRVKKLENIGFVWKLYDDLWEKMFEAMTEYKDKFGNCNVPLEWPENPKLGSWVGRQRTNHNKKSNKLSAERIERLNSLGFVWHTLKNAWDEMYEKLVDYKNRFGDCNVPSQWTEDKKFGVWCRTQRIQRRKNKLSQARINKLEKLGFIWDMQVSWDEMYSALISYKKRFGHCNVPQLWTENRKLGRWCNTQRLNYKKEIMPQDRIKKLEKIGFIWDTKGLKQKKS
ncbi:MAG: Helicase associated domain protein [Bacteroidota bacterium]